MKIRWPWAKKASNSHELWTEIYGRPPTWSGKTVTLDTALQVSTVLACVKVIAEGISQVPLKLMRETDNGKQRIAAKKHPLYDVLSIKANERQTSFEFRETIAIHCALFGNAYVFQNVVNGKIRELIPFPPNRVQRIKTEYGDIVFDVEGPNGKIVRFPEMMIWHIKGPSWDGEIGMETMHLARQAIGLAIATDETTARLQANGTRTSGIYSVEGTLTAEQYKSLQSWVKANYEGAENAGRTIILDRNAKWLNTQMTGIDAQHLETRIYQIQEVCRYFRVMPIMVGHSDKTATYASAEQMFLAHVVHTLSPWYSRLEQSIDANLLSPSERANGYYSDFVEEGLLRGDMRATADVLVQYTSNGIMTRNEARAKLDMNPLDGLDEPLTPSNLMGDTAQVGDANAQAA